MFRGHEGREMNRRTFFRRAGEAAARGALGWGGLLVAAGAPSLVPRAGHATRHNGPPPVARFAEANWVVEARRLREQAPGLHRGDRFPPGLAAFTFDDGPSPTKTPGVLDALAEGGARAVFFVVGTQIDSRSFALVKRTVAEGHALGNHTYRHDFDLARGGRRHDVDYVRRELLLTQAMVDLALVARDVDDFVDLRSFLLPGVTDDEPGVPDSECAGRWRTILARWKVILEERVAGLHPYPLVYARTPGGEPYFGRGTSAERRAMTVVLRELGLLNVLWHSSSGDSDARLERDERWRPERLVHNVLAGVRRGGVVLMHDRIPPLAVRRALLAIDEEPGYALLTLDAAIDHKYGCSPEYVLARLPTPA